MVENEDIYIDLLKLKEKTNKLIYFDTTKTGSDTIEYLDILIVTGNSNFKR